MACTGGFRKKSRHLGNATSHFPAEHIRYELWEVRAAFCRCAILRYFHTIHSAASRAALHRGLETMRRRARNIRKNTKRRRLLRSEQLEDRRLLVATLDLIPSTGAITEEGGVTVVTVAPGEVVNVTTEVSTSDETLSGFQLNFSNSDAALTLNNYTNGDFTLPADGNLDSAAATPDFFVSSGNLAPLTAPQDLGAFDITAPLTGGDFRVSANFTTGTELTNTLLSDSGGGAVAIEEFGDLIVRVAVDAPDAVLDLTPSSTNGTVTEENGVTVISVPAGEVISVSAGINSSEVDVLGFQLNLGNSDPALSIANFSNGDFPIGADSIFDPTLATPDRFVASGSTTALEVPPPRVFGTFEVTAPDVVGDFTLTSNLTDAGELLNTLVTDGPGNALEITDFGDVIIRVTPVQQNAILDLIPTGGTVTEENGTTVITVAPDSVVNVSAQITSSDVDVLGFQLNLGNSDAALAIDNFSNGEFPIGADSEFDSTAAPVDRFVSSASTTALEVPPPRVFGTFDVTVPSTEGDFTLTSNFSSGGELVDTIVTDAAGTALTVTDFGDVIIRVAAPVLPTVTLDAATQTVNEDAGTVNVTVNLSAASATDVTVPFTVSGTATDGSDFTITASPITIAAGQTSASAVVMVTDDSEVEPTETVIVTLDTPSGATLAGTTLQTINITDNDIVTPTVSISSADQTVSEDAGSVNVTVTLSTASATDVTIPFTVSGTATDGSDFTITTSPITIAAGQTSASAVVTVIDDSEVEPTETVIVTLDTPTGATLAGTTSQTISITDNDMDVVVPTVSISGADQTVSEDAGTVNVIVTLSTASASDVSIPFTVSGTATNGSDFTATTSPVVIAAGATSATVAVNVIDDDAVAEPAETVIVSLGAPVGATLSGTTAQTITIQDNDAVAPVTPTVSFTAATQTGVESIGTLTIDATLSSAATTAVTVPFAVSGTAASSDFSISASPITFAAGSTTASVTINVVDDLIDEGNETVIVTLGTPTGADLGFTTVHTATIIDDDGIVVGDSRIIIPDFVARPHVIPGDSQATAILFRAEVDTVLTVGEVGSTSLTDTITVLDETLASIATRDASGFYSATLTEGSLYAVIIQGRDSQGIFSIRSSEGASSLTGSATNILFPADVNADGQATALDALTVINRLSQEVLAEGEQVGSPARFYDVNGDGAVSASDALRIINQIGMASAESEPVAVATTTLVEDGSAVSAEDEPVVESNSIVASDAGSVASFDVADLLARSFILADLDTSEESDSNIDDALNDDEFLDGLLF